MVVSRHPEASRVGAEVLREGGNAVDAAVAVSMALAVLLPQAGNIGGGGFLLYRRASDGFVTSIDFRETAPAAAHRDLYSDGGDGVDTLRARWGHQAAGVPGTVAGLHMAWSKYGHLPWSRLVEPAALLAEKGFAANEELRRAIAEERPMLERFPATAALLLPGGEPLAPGRIVVQPELARTLRSIAATGTTEFYTGAIAKALAGEMRRGGGLITLDDLSAYRPVERDVLRGRYRDLEILSMPPPSSGGITLLQILGILEAYDLESMGRETALHILIEAMSRSFADRNAYLGDPDFVQIPKRGLLAPAYLAARRHSLSLDRATPSRFIVPGDPWVYQAQPGASNTDSSASAAAGREAPGAAGQADSSAAGAHLEPDETTHVSIVDAQGDVVAMTVTLNGGFGCGVLVEGAGFLLNNEMDDFDARPGARNMYGLVGGEANSIAPGKRMLSSMTPAIVLQNGRPWLVLGARGGPRIITAVAQALVNRRDFGLDLALAVAAPRLHHQWLPDVVFYEEGALAGATAEGLRHMGHALRLLPPYKSSLQCIEITPAGLLLGVSDPRTQGAAVGY